MSRLLIQTQEVVLVRCVLATVWIMTGILSFGVFPQQESLKLLAAVGLHDGMATIALYSSASLDLLLGAMTLCCPSIRLWRVQAMLIVAYTVIITVALPEFWLHPFGPILKNLPILLLLWLLHRRASEEAHG